MLQILAPPLLPLRIWAGSVGESESTDISAKSGGGVDLISSFFQHLRKKFQTHIVHGLHDMFSDTTIQFVRVVRPDIYAKFRSQFFLEGAGGGGVGTYMKKVRI